MADLFKDKVAIVTGGASGIGQALCEALCRQNARVIIADINDTAAQKLAASLSAAGTSAQAAHLDVADFEQVRKLVTDTAAEYGRIDYMFNNAAATATRGEMYGLPLEPWQRAIDVNLLGVLYGTVTVYEVMAQQGFGHIVNIGSLAGLIGFPTSIPYAATKAAVINLSTSLRIEAASRGVRVSVVCPGPIHSEKPEPVKLIGTQRAAQLILNGVKRNKAIVVFPPLARILWWLYRLSPDLTLCLGQKFVRDYRRKNNTV